MKLDEWLRTRGPKHWEFAKRVSITPDHLARIMNGKRNPSPALLERIRLATGGLVRPKDFENGR